MVPDIILPVLARKHANTSEELRCQKSRTFFHSQLNQYLAAEQSGFLATVEIQSFCPTQCRMLRCQCRISLSSTYGSEKYVDVPTLHL